MNRAEVYAREHARKMIARAALLTADELLTALTELGSTADEVADRMRAVDIKGARGWACRCPIAEYIGTFLGVRSYAVGRTSIEFDGGSGWQRIATPVPVSEFIRHFDRGVYLDLVGTNGADRDH